MINYKDFQSNLNGMWGDIYHCFADVANQRAILKSPAVKQVHRK